jgi:hypothetical protein
VDMIIGRDNPEWMPVPVQEEPYERFILTWTSLSPRCILRDNGGTNWRLKQQEVAMGSALDLAEARSGECTAPLKAELFIEPPPDTQWIRR